MAQSWPKSCDLTLIAARSYRMNKDKEVMVNKTEWEAGERELGLFVLNKMFLLVNRLCRLQLVGTSRAVSSAPTSKSLQAEKAYTFTEHKMKIQTNCHRQVTEYPNITWWQQLADGLQHTWLSVSVHPSCLIHIYCWHAWTDAGLRMHTHTHARTSLFPVSAEFGSRWMAFPSQK